MDNTDDADGQESPDPREPDRDPAETTGPRRPSARRSSGRRFSRRRSSARARVLGVGVLVCLALGVLAATVPVPYVALGPGSTYNTIASGQGHPVITFAGDDVPAVADDIPSGHLNMLTIRVVDHIPLTEAVAMWASGTYEFAPREEYYPAGTSKQDVRKRSVARFQDSQSTAEIEALRYLDYPNVVYVSTVADDSPSHGRLEPNDRVTAIDGHAITDYDSLQSVMAETTPGQTVTVDVARDETHVTRSVTLAAEPDQGPQGFLGIGVVERPDAPFTVSISLQDIGGPSAGMMFTLGIIDRLTPGDMTGGHFIAGTGTMQLDGTVGPIGGVTLKEVTARSAGAEYMLVPADNCAEALTAVPDGLTLVTVSTLDDAVTAVHTIADGGTPPTCTP